MRRFCEGMLQLRSFRFRLRWMTMRRGDRRRSEGSWQVLKSVTDAAERFVNRTPRLKRLEGERQALLDAIRRAQLLLSLKRWSAGNALTPIQSATHESAHRARSK